MGLKSGEYAGRYSSWHPLFDKLPDPLALVSVEVVHDDALPVPQARCEHFFEVGLEDRGGYGAFHRLARTHPLQGHARKQGGVRPTVARDLRIGPTPPKGV